MPMNAGSSATSGLAHEIKQLVIAKNPQFSGNVGDQMDWLFDAVAEAVITHITTNMEVVTSVTNTPVGTSPAETYAEGVGTSTSIS